MQNVLTNSPDSSQATEAKKFLALTELNENPKGLIAAEAEVQKELMSDPEYLPALMAQAALDEQRGQIKPATEIYTGILRRLPDFAAAQKGLARLYAQDPSATATAYDLAAKARQALPDDAELAELLAQLSCRKRNTSARSNYYRKVPGRNHSTPILFVPGNVAASNQTKDRSTRSP